jgi:hypothetical protein
MVGWDTVTDICRDKGRFSGEPPFVFLGAMRVQQSASGDEFAARMLDAINGMLLDCSRLLLAKTMTIDAGHHRPTGRQV